MGPKFLLPEHNQVPMGSHKRGSTVFTCRHDLIYAQYESNIKRIRKIIYYWNIIGIFRNSIKYCIDNNWYY